MRKRHGALRGRGPPLLVGPGEALRGPRVDGPHGRFLLARAQEGGRLELSVAGKDSCSRNMQLGRSEARTVGSRPRGVSVLRPPPTPGGAWTPALTLGTAHPPWASASLRGDVARGGDTRVSVRPQAEAGPRAQPVREQQTSRQTSGVPRCPRAGLPACGPESCSPPAPSAPALAASGRAGHEGRAAASRASWGPASSASPRPPPAL